MTEAADVPMSSSMTLSQIIEALLTKHGCEEVVPSGNLDQEMVQHDKERNSVD